MKNFKNLLQELPAKKIVIAFGRFNPPTTGHELLVNKTTQFASRNNIPHRIYVTHTEDKKKNPLPQKRKIYFMERMFGKGANLVGTGGEQRTIIEVAKALEKEKFTDLVLVAGSDRVPQYRKLLEQYNGKDYKFNSIEVVSSGKRDPDSDQADGMSATKMREAAKAGKFAEFKRGIPAKMTVADAKRMFNEVRQGMGLDPIKEEISFQTSEIREKYINEEIFAIGSVVEDSNGVYEVVDRGSNYITVVNESGVMSKKWLHQVVEIATAKEAQPILTEDSTEIEYKGFKTQNFHMCPTAKTEFLNLFQKDKDPVAVLNALRLTEEYLSIEQLSEERGYATQSDVDRFQVIQLKTSESLKKIDELDNHDYMKIHSDAMLNLLDQNKGKDEMLKEQMKFSSADRIKVARIIGGALGVSEPEKQGNPTQLVNMGLRKIRTKRITPEFATIVDKMLNTARIAGIDYDDSLLPATMKQIKARQDKEMKEGANVDRTKEQIAREKDADKKKHQAMMDRAKESDSRMKMKKEEVVSEEKKRFTVIANVEDPATMAGGEKKDKQRKVRSVLANSPNEAKAIATADLKKSGWKVNTVFVKESAEKIEEVKKPSVETTDTNSTFNIAKSIMSYDDFKKMLKIQGGLNKNEAAYDGRNEFGVIAKKRGHNPDGTEKEVDPHPGHNPANIHEPDPHKRRADQYDFMDSVELDGEVLAEGRMKELAMDLKDLPADEFVKKYHKTKAEMMKSLQPTKEAIDPEKDYLSDREIEDIISKYDDDFEPLDDEDLMDLYDDDELEIVDEEDEALAESVLFEGDESNLNEVLSRTERIKARIRIMKTRAKRQRNLRIALKKHSSQQVINKRARRLAIKALKQRLFKKPASKMSVGEKERAEARIKKMPAVINRIAMKLAPKVRRIEKKRLSSRRTK